MKQKINTILKILEYIVFGFLAIIFPTIFLFMLLDLYTDEEYTFTCIVLAAVSLIAYWALIDYWLLP